MLAWLRWTATRTVEVVLAVTGLGYTIVNEGSSAGEAIFLSAWATLALAYLLVGGLKVRRQRHRDMPPARGPSWGGLAGAKFSILFTVAASVTGLGAALVVIDN